ncbi:hypothetical protein J437_LFUL011839 [Ladona fulva]|uniref:Uncharacterized protein n=1 Tax=Ladona fulva TaxID=123851 RepID=A0A8K0K407_LADFU|nr:hypothetical protein J437_LFUL011839 [Ladona fulva]
MHRRYPPRSLYDDMYDPYRRYMLPQRTDRFIIVTFLRPDELPKYPMASAVPYLHASERQAEVCDMFAILVQKQCKALLFILVLTILSDVIGFDSCQ